MLKLALECREGLSWSGMSEKQAPYISLGNHLKYVREQVRQSMAEVSGAVEIEEITLERIEAGLERPEEEVLLLLISHFGMQDREAVQLWELANYDSEVPDEIRFGDNPSPGKQTIMLLVDVRTMYSDGLDVIVTPAGVTMNFTQMAGQGQNSPVARVGMSRDQAEKVLKALEQALMRARYVGPNKLLPPANS